jgi:hypothetical protein
MPDATIDRSAPVVAEANILIPAAPGDVFAVVADIGAWSQIYAELRDVTIDGPVVPGATFSFKSGPGRIDATVVTVDEPNLLHVEGRGMGATSHYAFTLVPTLGGTRLSAAQSMSGLAVRAAKKMLQGIADTSLRDWLEGIKTTTMERRDA